jgi:hypothetical protein
MTAPQLFPERTLAYIRVNDARELKEAMSRSSMGKLSQDEQIRPILAEFYGSLVNTTEAMRQAIGLDLDELLSIPTGEFAIAVLPSDQTQGSARTRREEGRTEVRVEVTAPSVAILLDAGEEIAGVNVLLERLDATVADRMVYSETKLGRLTLHQYSNPNRAREKFGYFIDGGVFVGCSDLVSLERLARRWNGDQVDWPSLAENRRFTSIMGRCVGTQGERPQLSFYVDPLAIIRQVAPQNAGTSMAFAMLPALGLDGIEAIGGSSIISPPDFDSISHFHILLSSPRRAVLALVRPRSGSTTPEDWVPDSASSYMTLNWDVVSTLQGIEQLYDQFRGPGAMEEEVYGRVSDRLGLDFRKDILDSIDGRFTLLQSFTRPVQINSGTNGYAIKLTRPEYFKKNVLPKLLDLVRERGAELSSESFGPWQMQVFEPRGAAAASGTLRRPEVCVGVVENYLIITDSRFVLREMLAAHNDGERRLNQALDFQLIMDRITAQLQGKECAAVSYSRPEESLQLFYELARDPSNRERLRELSQNNGFFAALLAALDNHKLPEFSVIAKYLAPRGGFLVEEETGLHYMSFGLRRE